MNITFKNSIYLKYKYFFNIINVFTVTFDQFNAYMMNFLKETLIPNFC